MGKYKVDVILSDCSFGLANVVLREIAAAVNSRVPSFSEITFWEEDSMPVWTEVCKLNAEEEKT